MNQILPLLFPQLVQYTVNNPYTHKSAMSLMGPGLSFSQTWQDSDKVEILSWKTFLFTRQQSIVTHIMRVVNQMYGQDNLILA